MKKVNIPLVILTIISSILVCLFVINIYKINLVPIKYLAIAIAILLVVSIIATLLSASRKIYIKVFGYIIFGILIILSAAGIYYTAITINFINKSFNNIKNTYTNSYLVLTDTDLEEIYSLANKKIGYYKSIPNINLSLEKLKTVIDYEDISYSDVVSMFEDLSKKEIDAIIIEKTIYQSMVSSLKTISFDKYNKVYEFEITIDEEIPSSEVKNVSNIYISGLDFTLENSDFNMVVTINKEKRTILLTSIPRDYYIYIPSLDMKDSIEFSAIWGINTNKEALERLFDIKIDYTLGINTQSLVKLVDTLGKVEFCSDRNFWTFHSTVLDTYDDSKGYRLFVEAGCHEYTGVEILTIARERLAYATVDIQRQKNCQQIMINIFNKMLKFETVFNYVNILDALSDLYTTNIPDKLITDILSDIVSGSDWKIETQYVDGWGSEGAVHAGSSNSYVMIPNASSVETASNFIKEMSKD